MPTYEYECQKCGHRFEKFQKMTEEPVKKCPECKGKTKRLIGVGGGIIFKGAGFYTTEYRSAEYKQKASQEANSSSSSSCTTCSTKSCSTCAK